MGESNIPNPVTGKPSGATNDEELMLATLTEMHRYNIVKAVTSGPLEVVYRWKTEEPNLIIGGVYFDEVTSLPDVEQLRQQFIDRSTWSIRRTGSSTCWTYSERFAVRTILSSC